MTASRRMQSLILISGDPKAAVDRGNTRPSVNGVMRSEGVEQVIEHRYVSV
jgi:hypothetical protein